MIKYFNSISDKTISLKYRQGKIIKTNLLDFQNEINLDWVDKSQAFIPFTGWTDTGFKYLADFPKQLLNSYNDKILNSSSVLSKNPGDAINFKVFIPAAPYHGSILLYRQASNKQNSLYLQNKLVFYKVRWHKSYSRSRNLFYLNLCGLRGITRWKQLTKNKQNILKYSYRKKRKKRLKFLKIRSRKIRSKKIGSTSNKLISNSLKQKSISRTQIRKRRRKIKFQSVFLKNYISNYLTYNFSSILKGYRKLLYIKKLRKVYNKVI
jgi:hypothetical protein